MERGAPAAFFDLDKTVIAGASMVAFGRRFYDAGLVTRRVVVRAVWGQLVYLHLGASEEKLARMRESVLALTRGWERDRVRSIVEEALATVVEPITYAEALDLIAEHKAAGRPVVIVSASPEEIVVPIGQLLGADHVVATRAEVDEAGRYTGGVDFYAYGPFKVEAMLELAEREGIDLAASYAYSDSFTDLPMLEAVGHPVAVNPDRPLAKAAAERGFEVRLFRRPVKVRSRLPAATGTATGVALGVAAAVVGAYGWWRLVELPRRAAVEVAERAAAEAAARARGASWRRAPRWPRARRG